MFGRRLASRLSRDPDINVIVAGRSLARAQAFCENRSCTPVELDSRAPDFPQQVRILTPDVIIDASGPFQTDSDQPYYIVETAIELGADYLDLSDDADFTSGITVLDGAAKIAGTAVLSGVSSVPAISSAVCKRLVRDIVDVHSIESVILPGNRAPRGVSVMTSILKQVGRPLRLWQTGRWIEVPAWSDLSKRELRISGTQPVLGRRASNIGAPDLRLFPSAFKARSVSFRAGLELSIMQRGLWMLHWLPRLKLLKSVSFLVMPLKRLADCLEPFGSDRGGMLVEVKGRTEAGDALLRRWTLIVERGDGPFIPSIPAEIMLQKLFTGDVISGARACLGEFSMIDLSGGFDDLAISTEETHTRIETVFENVLEGAHAQLPSVLRDLHGVLHKRRWCGEAVVNRGTGWLSGLVGWIAGFPPASDSVPVEVEMTKTERGETWVRRFGTKQFQSFLSNETHQKRQVLIERFGWMSFRINLNFDGKNLNFPVIGGRLFGLPLPPLFLPRSETREYVDDAGRACFDVRISLPIAGLVAHYKGWLRPVISTG